MGGCAWRRGETEEAAAVARTAAFTSVTVDGRLELTRGAKAFPLALIGVQVFHVPESTHTQGNTSDQQSNIHRASINIIIGT